MKALFWLVVGAGAMYLYLNPGDFDGLVVMGKGAVHDVSSTLADLSEQTPKEKLDNLLNR